MAGVKAAKAKKLQKKAASKTSRTVKGKNKAPKVSRTDKPKGAAKRKATVKGSVRATG